jgi:hypothetical protein
MKLPVSSLVPPIYSFRPLYAEIFRRKSVYVSVAMGSRKIAKIYKRAAI